MKSGIHPQYRTVVFHDTSADAYFKVGSTIKTEKTIEFEGERFPYVTLDVSSQSHPFYTGKQKNDFTRRENRAVPETFCSLPIKRGEINVKVLSSLKTAKQRHPDCQVVRRRGRVYVICKTNPRFKAVQGCRKKR